MIRSMAALRAIFAKSRMAKTGLTAAGMMIPSVARKAGSAFLRAGIGRKAVYGTEAAGTALIGHDVYGKFNESRKNKKVRRVSQEQDKNNTPSRILSPDARDISNFRRVKG